MKIGIEKRYSDELLAVWVGDLGDYNAGILRGKWIVIDEDTTVEEIHKHIQEILKTGISDDFSHEDWMIFDYNNLPLSGSFTPLETIVEVARFVRKYGYTITKTYINIFGEEHLNLFEEIYCGTYSSLTDYAYKLVNDCFEVEKFLEKLACYFDYEAHGRDLETNGDITSIYLGPGQIAIFRNY